MKIVLRLVAMVTLVGGTLLYTYNGIETKEDSSEVRDYDDLLEGYSVSDLLKKEIELVKANKKKMELKQLRDKLKEEELEKQRVKQREEELAKLKLQQEEDEKREERKSDVATSRGLSLQVPRADTSNKTYMSYRAITNRSSKQYQLQQRDDVYTDSEGFRKIGDQFMVAVGTYYGHSGDNIQVKLENGTVFNAIIGDSKDNKHTDKLNQRHAKDGSVIEFIVDSKKLITEIKRSGNCSNSRANKFQSNVVEIINLSRP